MTEENKEETKIEKEQPQEQSKEEQSQKNEIIEESAAKKAPSEPETKTVEQKKEALSKETSDEEQKKELQDFSYLKPGMTVRVHQKIQEAGKKKGEIKERIQIFEGIIIAIRGKRISKTITVRKVSGGIGVEKIFPLHLPTIAKIEPIKQARVRRAKLYYLRDHKKKLKERRIKK